MSNIELLKLNNTYTVTTGHQLSLFTGPLYFLVKIINVIKLADRLNQENKEINIQDKTVRRKSCLISIFFIGLLKEKIKIIPIIKVKMLETKKTCQSLWPYARSIIIGKFIAKDVKQSKTPMT